MDSVLEQTAAVSAPTSAYRSGFLVGRLLAAGIIVGGLLVLAGVILATSATHAGPAAGRGSGGGSSGVAAGPARAQDGMTPTPVQATPQVPAGTDAVLAPLMNATGYEALRNTAVLGISPDTYVRAQGFDARTGQIVRPNLGLIYWAVARYARTTMQGEAMDVVETVLAQTLDVDYGAMTPQQAYLWTQQLMGAARERALSS